MRKRTVPEFFYNSENEHRKLIEKARSSGLSKADFIRKLVDGCVIKEAPPAEYYRLIREMRAVGNSMNQVVKLANTRGLLDVPSFKKSLADLRETEKMLWSAFSKDDKA